MKLFLIDKYGKNYDIVKSLENKGIENIEVKENCKLRATKNDVIVLLEDSDIEEIPKTPSVILVTKKKNVKFIWSFINTCHCIDVIDANMARDYIINRIAERIGG